MKVAILGFGTVGKSVYEIIKSNFPSEIEIVKILVKNERKNIDITTTKFNEIINDDKIDLIVEVMGGLKPAYDYIKQALLKNKNVVSANKTVISENLQEFVEVAKNSKIYFKYEASVCGGIPFLETLKKIKRIDEVNYIGGIFNGTSNFILDKMSKQKSNFNDVLKEAQNLGYAESDLTDDVKGFDIQRKLSISTSLAFNSIIKNEDIFVAGIENINKFDIDVFKKQNLVVKLYAISIKKNKKYLSVVEPVLFNRNSIEANIGGNYNIACINGNTIGDIKLYGQGAGGYPTANAIVQDILDIKNNINFNSTFDFNKKYTKDVNLLKSKYYIRTTYSINENIVDKKINTNNITYYITKPITCDIINSIYKNSNDMFYARINQEIK